VANSIEAVCAGTIDLDQYLSARFIVAEEPTQVTPGFEPHSVPQAASRQWRELLKRLVRAHLPPLVQRLIPLSKMILWEVLPPAIWRRLRRRWRPESVVAPPPIEVEDEPQPVLAGRLERIDALREYWCCQRFKEDLERLLSLTGCAPGDHVFLPTAHGRELCAVLELMATWPIEAQPTFHLEFRHALEPAGSHAGLKTEHPYTTVHRAFFDHARLFAPTDRLRLYTDTEELSEDYERFSGLDFGVLPIPFRTRFLASRARQEGPICLAFFGDVREEKGFHWLPDLINALMEEHLASGRVRFLIQATLVHPEHETRCKAALDELKNHSEGHVRLVGLDGPLAPDLYYQLVSEADALLCPYHPEAYRWRSSGTLTEAISAGIPTVVPQGTWLARQQPLGSGETFKDRESFIAAVQRVCDRYPAYHLRASAGRESWLEQHSPDRLVRALLGAQVEQSSPMGKVA
jgi:glycosyltransferase involved in cell wall biosynthesis